MIYSNQKQNEMGEGDHNFTDTKDGDFWFGGCRKICSYIWN